MSNDLVIRLKGLAEGWMIDDDIGAEAAARIIALTEERDAAIREIGPAHREAERLRAEVRAERELADQHYQAMRAIDAERESLRAEVERLKAGAGLPGELVERAESVLDDDSGDWSATMMYLLRDILACDRQQKGGGE